MKKNSVRICLFSLHLYGTCRVVKSSSCKTLDPCLFMVLLENCALRNSIIFSGLASFFLHDAENVNEKSIYYTVNNIFNIQLYFYRIQLFGTSTVAAHTYIKTFSTYLSLDSCNKCPEFLVLFCEKSKKKKVYCLLSYDSVLLCFSMRVWYTKHNKSSLHTALFPTVDLCPSKRFNYYNT